MTSRIWPPYARIQTDGYRLTWRQPVQRIVFDDGLARQALAGQALTRVRDVTAWILDADRPRFLAWLDRLGPVNQFAWRDIDARREARIVGGRGGIRWTRDAASRGRWWRAEMAIEGLESAFAGPAFVGDIDDQVLLRDSAYTIRLPASATTPAGLVYSLSPAPPTGIALDLDARTLSGTPTAIQAPTEYTWTATDAEGRTDTVTFTVSVVIQLVFEAAISAQIWWRNASVTLQLPAVTSPPTGLTYSLSPAPPAGMVLDLAARTLSGIPSATQIPAEYTWTATDREGETVTETFDVGIGVSIWDAASAPLGDGSHIYYRHTQSSPGATAAGLEGPASDISVIYLWGRQRAIADYSAALPAWMYEHVPEGQTPYIRWPILEATSDGDRLLQLGQNPNKFQFLPLWSIPHPNPTLIADIGAAVRIGGVDRSESLGALRAIGGIYPRLRAQAAASNGETFAALRGRAATVGTILGFLIAYIGDDSVVDLEHGITYLGGTRPATGSG